MTDHGFTVGDGVFEAIKVVDGLPFALTRHLDRLARSAAGLGLPALDEDAVRRGRRGGARGGRTCRWAGCGSPTPAGRPRWAPAAATSPPTLVVVADAMGPWPRTTAVATVPWPRNERGALAGLKTTSYAENVVALARGAASAARPRRSSPTWPGTCARAPGSNVFYVVDGELRTPTLASGCLAGVTRALVLEWYGGVEVDEPIEVLRAGRARCSWPRPRATSRRSPRWDDRELPAPGPVTAEAARGRCGAARAGATRTLSRAGPATRPSRSRWSLSVPAGTAARVRVRNR